MKKKRSSTSTTPRRRGRSLLDDSRERLMGLDLSLRATGIAVIDREGRKLHSETIKFHKETPRTRRLQEIRDRVLHIAQQYDVTDSVCEVFSVRSGAAAGAVATLWLHGIVQLALSERGFQPSLYIAPATLKKWWTGAGVAEKEDMIFAAETEFGEVFSMKENDQCDAFLLAQLLRFYRNWTIRGVVRGSAYEREAMARWKRYL